MACPYLVSTSSCLWFSCSKNCLKVETRKIQHSYGNCFMYFFEIPNSCPASKYSTNKDTANVPVLTFHQVKSENPLEARGRRHSRHINILHTHLSVPGENFALDFYKLFLLQNTECQSGILLRINQIVELVQLTGDNLQIET